MALKKHYPDITFSGNYVDPDEVDGYIVYNIFRPVALGAGTAASVYAAIGTFAGGTASQAKALVLQTTEQCDYPRTLRVSALATADHGGTLVVNGVDQFGNTITETIGYSTQAKGTVQTGANGTKVFAQVTSGTFTYATAGSGAASAVLGYNTGGTTTIFGLPCKLGATTDLVHMSAGTNSVGFSPNGGTIAGYVNLGMHAITAPKDLTGTCDWINVWIKPSYNSATTAISGRQCNLEAAT